MFEIPGAKRVKRSKLFDHSSSSEESDVSHSHTKLSEKHSRENLIDYGFEYEFIDKLGSAPSLSTTQPATSTSKPEDDEEDNVFEFNLFKPTGTAAQADIPAPKYISIRSASDQEGSITRKRPLSHYFTGFNSNPAYRDTSVAVSGSTIEQLAQVTWPGAFLPWRIISGAGIRISHGIEVEAQVSRQVQGQGASRARPSKKRRILLRSRLALRLERQALAAASAEAKEVAEREKRTRRNREKKVKRKEREKRKKLEGAVGSDAGAGGEMHDAASNVEQG